MGVDLHLSQYAKDAGRFPHTRGGGPGEDILATGAPRFSPHAWGWTYASDLNETRNKVFPTRVGVDLVVEFIAPPPISFPHTRGGGPLRRW